MMKEFDIHTLKAAELFNKPPEEITPEERRKVKEINFCIIYGFEGSFKDWFKPQQLN